MAWRSIFLINVPIGIAVVVVASRHVPSRDTTSSGRLDLPGAVLGAAALAGITYGLTAQEWLIFAIGLVIAVAFVLFELRSRAPMVPMSIFRSAQFSATNVVTFLLYGAFAAPCSSSVSSCRVRSTIPRWRPGRPPCR